jgi:hypothetical protein
LDRQHEFFMFLLVPATLPRYGGFTGDGGVGGIDKGRRLICSVSGLGGGCALFAGDVWQRSGSMWWS